MGVEFKICGSCGDTFPDCGIFTRCVNSWCSSKYCDDKCAAESCTLGDWRTDEDSENWYNSEQDMEDEREGFEYKWGYLCNICLKKDIEDYELIEYMLKKLNMTRKEVVKEYYGTK